MPTSRHPHYIRFLHSGTCSEWFLLQNLTVLSLDATRQLQLKLPCSSWVLVNVALTWAGNGTSQMALGGLNPPLQVMSKPLLISRDLKKTGPERDLFPPPSFPDTFSTMKSDKKNKETRVSWKENSSS